MQALWKPKLFPQKQSESPKSDISSLLVGLTTLDLGCHQSINLADRMQKLTVIILILAIDFDQWRIKL